MAGTLPWHAVRKAAPLPRPGATVEAYGVLLSRPGATVKAYGVLLSRPGATVEAYGVLLSRPHPRQGAVFDVLTGSSARFPPRLPGRKGICLLPVDLYAEPQVRACGHSALAQCSDCLALLHLLALGDLAFLQMSIFRRDPIP